MSALIAGLALATALHRSAAPSALVTQQITCGTNANVSDSGCNETGSGESGNGNDGNANSGSGNHGNANSGSGNNGNANSGSGNTGNGNSGCNNNGDANSGAGNTGNALSGGTSSCHTAATAPPTTSMIGTGSTLPTASTVSPVTGQTLPLTGRNSEAPLALAMGLMVAGGAAVGLANRRRHAMAAVTGGEAMPLSTAVGLLLTGRAKASKS